MNKSFCLRASDFRKRTPPGCRHIEYRLCHRASACISGADKENTKRYLSGGIIKWIQFFFFTCGLLKTVHVSCLKTVPDKSRRKDHGDPCIVERSYTIKETPG